MKLDKDGLVADSSVSVRRFPLIEHGALETVHAIVVHQTDADTEIATFNSYRVKKFDTAGAHFLIGRDGKIYQTASLKKRCYHVGRLIKSKCLQISKTQCEDAELIKALSLSWSARIDAINGLERAKKYPDRYPVNSDSIGIEIVGKSLSKTSYENITPLQQASLRWLIAELNALFSLATTDVYRHPEVSYKNDGEAASATWK